MYNHIWKKYLPIIKILMKKSASEDQVLDLNRVDFERAGTGRKAGYKFTIEFTDGKVGNVISGSTLAMHLASVVLEDDGAKQILQENNYEVSLNTKFQLSIKNVSPAIEETKIEPVESNEKDIPEDVEE
ncbi:MAG: hypothetical protein M3Z92_04990 [Bacteroidota bacterium]|nr:hypothetical protein [Bacteroidota bacterium]